PWVLVHYKRLDSRFILHPIMLFLLLHLAWMGLTTINAANPMISLKFYLSKMWYVGIYLIMAFYFLTSIDDYKKLFRVILIPLLITVVIIIFRHGFFYGFAYSDVNFVMGPFYRN